MSEPSPIGQMLLHESALGHVSGKALYVDDLPAPSGLLFAQPVGSVHAHARLRRLDVSRAREVSGVVAVLTGADIPGENNCGPVVHDEPVLAANSVHFVGQAMALVVASSLEACRAGAAAVDVDYEVLPAIVSLDEAIAQHSWLSEEHFLERGEADAALASAPVRLAGEIRTGGQDHFYLETQCTLAVPEEGGGLHLYSSTQHPSEVQTLVAQMLGLKRNRVTVEVPRLGGAFGGKETQAAPYACMAALAAWHSRRPVKVWLNRDQDMQWTGKRHPFLTRYEVGLERDGSLLALKAQLYCDGGFSTDLSLAILDRALFHIDNAYFLPHVRATGRVAKTNLASNTAFRGFGGPQGMAVIETILSRASEVLRLDPLEVRRKNLYGPSPRHLTPYWQEVRDNRLPRIIDELTASSAYAERLRDVRDFNATQTWAKRGLALTCVKFGISFTTSFLNQAGALVMVYADGSVQLNHGGTEMGQGLHTKMLAICAHELGVPLDSIRVMNTATDKVPNTSATAASSGSDLNGQAVRQACCTLRERLAPVAAQLLGLPSEVAGELHFASGRIFHRSQPAKSLAFEAVAEAAHLGRVSMAATGFYQTPDISFDKVTRRGNPFHYFVYGAAVSEVEVSGLTGEHRLRRVDVLEDVGNSLVPTIDRGQIEGAFLQGWGWLTIEELRTNRQGELLTHSPDTYKIPAFGDAPVDFRVSFFSEPTTQSAVMGSKAVGEPPFMLALSALAALRHAVSAFGAAGRDVELAIPCTPEAVLFAIERQRNS